MKDVVALGELLIDFAPVSTDEAGYPTLKAQPGARRAISWQRCRSTAAPPRWWARWVTIPLVTCW